MPSQWDAKADRDLLLAIIDAGNLSHVDWTAVSTKMKTKDYTFTNEACRQHYQKIRREARSSFAATPGTPTKPTIAPNTVKTPSSRRATNPKATQQLGVLNNGCNNEGDDEEDLFQSPSAKRRRSTVDGKAAKPRIVVDVENGNEDEIQVVGKQESGIPGLGGFQGQTAAQFKMEELGNSDGMGHEGEAYRRAVVDLMDEGIYAV